jgi:hypothetical protein
MYVLDLFQKSPFTNHQWRSTTVQLQLCCSDCVALNVIFSSSLPLPQPQLQPPARAPAPAPATLQQPHPPFNHDPTTTPIAASLHSPTFKHVFTIHHHRHSHRRLSHVHNSPSPPLPPPPLCAATISCLHSSKSTWYGTHVHSTRRISSNDGFSAATRARNRPGPSPTSD